MNASPDGDPWLERWIRLLKERVAGGVLLELGCGAGRDTAVLAAAGLPVVAVDRSAERIGRARTRVPSARFFLQDLDAPFPAERGIGAVVASLSLHYFPWDETVALVERIREHLRPGGALLCRLNSTGDVHHGATGHPEIERNYYLVDGVPKRFFDRASVARLLGAGWRTVSLQEQSVHRYEQPKMLWEALAERSE